MTTRGQSISRVRNSFKLVKEDPFITDRFLYALILKYGKALMKRQENEGKILGYTSLFQFLPCVDMIPVDKVQACCTGIKTKCTIMRSKDRLPTMLQGSKGPIIRTVATLDLSKEAHRTLPATYTNLTKLTSFKYNKEHYYWFLDGYLYVPNVSWEGVYVEAIFEDDIAPFLCNDDFDECTPARELPINIPEYLFAEIEDLVRQELIPTAQIPSDGADDSQNVMR